MKFGIDLPNLGYCGDARVLAEFAREAEHAGWDGVFVWDSVMSPAWDEHLGKTGPSLRAVCDPWIALAAIAAATQRVRIGPMVTPRRAAGREARATVTLDLSAAG
jgi:alkanesulfonate monooxygenase SsuD/methylene tetrahydromethanopterin reductase-like flavin-dependent oxidoreductase (luciferase family)